MLSYNYEEIEENKYIPARFELVNCGTFTFPAHWHEYVEILYLVKGHLTAIIQAESYTLSPGSIVVINPRDLHMTKSKGDTTYILLQISAEQMKRLFPDFESLRFHTVISSDGENKNAEALITRLQHMLNLYLKREDGYQLLFTAQLYEFLYHLYRSYSNWTISEDSQKNNRDFQRITQVMDWVRKNYSKPLKLDDAAEPLGVSREYFCRLFKKYTGQTFLEYVNSVRTMHLYDDLIRTDKSITLLMDKNGITNYKVFMRTFKKLYGDTPQAIRRNQMERTESKSLRV